MAYTLAALEETPKLEPIPSGILSLGVNVGVDLNNNRWYDGINFESNLCNKTVTIQDYCDVTKKYTVVTPVTANASGTTCVSYSGTPFTVEVSEKRSTFGFKAVDFQQRVLESLDACKQTAIEREFWTGTLAKQMNAANPGTNQNRYLNSGSAVTDVTPSSTAIKVRYGLALLEGALAHSGCGSLGVIHVTAEVGSIIAGMCKTDDAGVFRTPLGNKVVIGAGYPNTGPDGTIPQTGTWMYATGPVQVFVGQDIIFAEGLAQTVDRSINTVVTTGDLQALVLVDGCGIFAAHVDLQLDYA